MMFNVQKKKKTSSFSKLLFWHWIIYEKMKKNRIWKGQTFGANNFARVWAKILIVCGEHNAESRTSAKMHIFVALAHIQTVQVMRIHTVSNARKYHPHTLFLLLTSYEHMYIAQRKEKHEKNRFLFRSSFPRAFTIQTSHQKPKPSRHASDTQREWILFRIRENRHIDLDFIFHSAVVCYAFCCFARLSLAFDVWLVFTADGCSRCCLTLSLFVCECVKSMLYGASNANAQCVVWLADWRWRTMERKKVKICQTPQNWISFHSLAAAAHTYAREREHGRVEVNQGRERETEIQTVGR